MFSHTNAINYNSVGLIPKSSKENGWQKNFLANFTVTKDSRVCYQHFERHYYERDLRSEMLRTPGKYKLEEDVVPKIPGYLWCKHSIDLSVSYQGNQIRQ